MNVYFVHVLFVVAAASLVSGYYEDYVECTYNTYRYHCDGRQLNRESRLLTEFPTTNGEHCLLLARNRIRQFPSNLDRLEVVKSLDLSGNQITQFPSDLSAMNSLEHLNLANNQITSLPSKVAMPISLRALILAGNQISTIPSGLRVPSLFVLDLSSNNFASIPNDVCVSNQFTRVDFTGNRLTSDTTMYMETLNKCRNVNRIPYCVFVDHKEIKCDCNSLYPVLGATPSFCLGTPLLGQPIMCNPDQSSNEFKSKKLFDLDPSSVGKGCNFALRSESGASSLTFKPVVMAITIVTFVWL